MNENKIKIIIYLVLISIFLVILTFFGVFKNVFKNNEVDILPNEIKENYNFEDVLDMKEYQIVYNCMLNYFNNVNTNNSNVLDYFLLDVYKIQNNITLFNINNFIEKRINNYGYRVSNIKKYSNSYYTIYYVEGDYYLDMMDEIADVNKVKDLVVFDIANNTYAILPVINNNASFEEIIKYYNLNEYNSEIRINNYNEIQNYNLTESNEISLYFYEYLLMIKEDCGKAYEIVGSKTKENYKTFNDFRNLCELYLNEYNFPGIKSYSISTDNDKKKIFITDNYLNKYEFLINSVKDYSVDIFLK